MSLFRQVYSGDCQLLWEWANDPLTRRASFSSHYIPWDDHQKWFAAKLQDPHYLLWVILDSEGNPVGQVSFELAAKDAVISINLAPRRRRQGWGRRAIREACRRLFRTTDIQQVHAYVKPDNLASLKTFQHAGFIDTQPQIIQGQLARHFILSRQELPDLTGEQHD